MQVEILEVRLSSDGIQASKGDKITVADEIGAKWCGLGWAKDVSGTVPTGERRTQNVTINPKKIVQSQQATEVK